MRSSASTYPAHTESVEETKRYTGLRLRELKMLRTLKTAMH
jgi:hypothetical protein